MSSARVYRRLPVHLDEYVVMLFRVDQFPDSLSLRVHFTDSEVPYTVRRMSGDSIPVWFIGERFKDITSKTSVDTASPVNLSSRGSPCYGVEIGKMFPRPGTYDVRFIVTGIGYRPNCCSIQWKTY